MAGELFSRRRVALAGLGAGALVRLSLRRPEPHAVVRAPLTGLRLSCAAGHQPEILLVQVDGTRA